MFQFMNKKLVTWVALLVLVVFAAGCGSSPAPAPAPKPAAPAASAPAIDKAAVTKEAAWDGYKKVLADVSGKTFPLDPVKAKELLTGNESKYLVIDLRSAEDYAKGHVKGAVNIPLGQLPQNLDKLPMDKTLMLYCYSGQTSSMVMVPLKYYGYKVVSISRGFPSVEKAGFAVDTTAVAFAPVAAKAPADPKVGAAQAGLKDVLDVLTKQFAAKNLIVPGKDVKALVDAGADKYHIVDLRAADDYAKGYVKGAVSVPLVNLADAMKSFPKDKTIVLYCYSGQTAAMATVPLKAEGFKLISISTGFPGAQAGGFAVEKK
ncbi:MAG: rhodanese-like domain-containing protein [Negativicutes bacterium]